MSGNMERDPDHRRAMDRRRSTETRRYPEIEAAIAKVQGIRPDEASAFTARIRHLRNLGLPTDAPHPGHGRAAYYCSLDALQILIALRLHRLGVSPKIIVPLAYKIMLHFWLDEADEMEGKLEDLYVFIFPSDAHPEEFLKFGVPAGEKLKPENPPVPFVRGLDHMPKIEPLLPREFTRINVSAWARDLYAALEWQERPEC
jgi:hypothetical protein